jgi:hypothetical protein
MQPRHTKSAAASQKLRRICFNAVYKNFTFTTFISRYAHQRRSV